ncbi:hypothetical protein KR018_003676, partial [Drosophila ironensis]
PKKKVAATTAPPIPSQTTATTVASSQSGSAPEQTQAPPTLDLLERIASMEKELEQLRASTYNCTDLENNQRLLKALKDEARETVKSLLIHPRNVSAAVEQLRFRYCRPEQLVRNQLNRIREVPHISEHNLAKIGPFATRVSNLTA